MASFNSDLRNLFNNFQKQQKYKDSKFDANKDGKVNSNDEKFLKNKETNLLKKENIFDVNGDGNFNQKDVDMFLKGNVNGDKTTTQEEKDFINFYKNTFISALQKKNATFTVNGKKFVNGYISSGVSVELKDLDEINSAAKSVTEQNSSIRLMSAATSDESVENSNITEKTVTTDNYTITYKIQDGTIKSARQVNKDGSTVDFSYMNGIMTQAEKCFYNNDNTVKSRVNYIFDADGKSSPTSVMNYTYTKNKLVETTSLYYFDSDGNDYLASKDTYNYNGQEGDFSSMKTTAYDKQGNVITTISNGYVRNRDAKPLAYVSQDSVTLQFLDNKYIKLNKGDKVKISVHTATVTRADGSVTVYNASGDVKSYKGVSSGGYYNTGSNSYVPKSVKVKDAYVLPDVANKETIETENGQKTVYYDKDNKIIKEVETLIGTNGHKTVITTKYNGSKVISKTYSEVSEEGKTQNSYSYDYVTGKTTIAQRNEQGKVINKKVMNSHGEYIKYSYTYDDTGTLTSRKDSHYMADGMRRAVVDYTYDKNGHITNQTRNVYHSKTKKVYVKCKYKRDKNNKIKSELIKTYSPDGKTLYYSQTCTSGWY